ncbi:transmembrane protein 56-like [Puma concolor]|uniref:Transmembrane protein 56-like n=1 Tax=Puma concolor TaxID=9696 RepID=A0A6P6I555_PUMCO|nr:transmembrane protein 56-like [Puma concolor]
MDTNTKLIFSTVFTSFFTFQLLFYFISSWFSAKVSPGFNSLSFEKKIEWNSRKIEPGINYSIKENVKISKITQGQLSSYVISHLCFLLSDLLILILYWKVIGDKYFIIHHCTALYAYSIVLKDGVLAYIGNFRLLAELSSPFVNQRWFFEALKYPKFSKANVINGILMTVVFFIVRIVSMPPFYSYIYSVLGTEAYIRLGFLTQCSWISTCIVLDVMNVMWMIKITKGCVKVISLIRQEKAKSSLQNGKLD